MISATFFLRSLKGHCYGNQFLAQIGKNCHKPTLSSFCALAFHNGWEDRTTDDESISDKDYVNFGPVTRVLPAPLCWAGYTLGFATHF